MPVIRAELKQERVCLLKDRLVVGLPTLRSLRDPLFDPGVQLYSPGVQLFIPHNLVLQGLKIRFVEK